MTDIDIDKLEQLRSAATQGPFVHVTPPPGYSSGFIGYYVEHEGRRLRGEFPACDADDVYTVELLNAAPALIAEVRRLRSENERLQMQLAACGVLASCNTSDSLERHRQMHPDFLGASVHAVIEAAQREIKLLAEVRRLRAIEAAAQQAFDEVGSWRSAGPEFVRLTVREKTWDELRAALAEEENEK